MTGNRLPKKRREPEPGTPLHQAFESIHKNRHKFTVDAINKMMELRKRKKP
jgi:hypothetical protein